MTNTPDISIIPMYNEEEVIDEFFKTIEKTLSNSKNIHMNMYV